MVYPLNKKRIKRSKQMLLLGHIFLKVSHYSQADLEVALQEEVLIRLRQSFLFSLYTFFKFINLFIDLIFKIKKLTCISYIGSCTCCVCRRSSSHRTHCLCEHSGNVNKINRLIKLIAK